MESAFAGSLAQPGDQCCEDTQQASVKVQESQKSKNAINETEEQYAMQGKLLHGHFRIHTMPNECVKNLKLQPQKKNSPDSTRTSARRTASPRTT